MSTTVKSAARRGATKNKEQSSDKKKKNNKDDKTSVLANPKVSFSSTSHSSTSHQQHHSAPPSQSQQLKTGLQSINENVEYLPTNEQREQHLVNARFPRSSTVPYPVYATLRNNDGNRFPSYYYHHTDYPTFLQGTGQPHAYLHARQPFSSINTNNFQPISPHHEQYGSRPVDVLKPTFLIVPKDAEQQLSSQLSASNSPTPAGNSTTKASTKPMPKKVETKKQGKGSKLAEQPTHTVRSVEVQTGENSPPRTTNENEHQHVGLLATPNPSPYVHFVNVPYLTHSPQFFQDGPPETSIMQEEFIAINDYQPSTGTIRSMPNIALAQGKRFARSAFHRLVFDLDTCSDSLRARLPRSIPSIDFPLRTLRFPSASITSLARFLVRQSLAPCIDTQTCCVYVISVLLMSVVT